jgi:hypothetical protein
MVMRWDGYYHLYDGADWTNEGQSGIPQATALWCVTRAWCSAADGPYVWKYAE